MSSIVSNLSGKNIVITRPAHQSTQIKECLEQQQANVSLLPLIEIKDTKAQNLSLAKDMDWFVFISANAVEYGLKQLALTGISLSGKTIAAIGKKTALKLEQAGISIDIVPKDMFNTEYFLKLTATQSIQDINILIFRGNGGRECLAKTLQQRGANVEYAEVYRRSCPKINTSELKFQWRQQLLDMIVITSSEGLRNLYSICDGDWIKSTPLLLGSQRMKKAAIDLGHLGTVIMSENPSDEAVLHSLVTWSKQESNR